MEETPDSTETLTGKLNELLADTDNDGGQFCFEEEMIEEVMQEFYKEIAYSPLPKPPSPITTPLMPSPSYFPKAKVEEMPEKVTENGSLVVDDYNCVEGHEEDGGDFDDEWLARVLLTWGHVVDASEWF